MTIDLVDVDVSALADEELEAGICGFQARLSAATAVYVLAVAEYDRRRAWEAWECRSMTHFLSWKCGTGVIAAREQVRVGQALAGLPVIRERFCAGALSYSQVRALTRAATPETDLVLADLADVMTAAQLERVIRAYRRSGRVDEEAAEERHARRRLTYHWDDDGMLVGTFALPAEEGAVFAKAIEAVATPERVRSAEQDRATDPWGATCADALVEMASVHLARPSGEVGDDDDRHLVTVLVDRATLTGQPGKAGEITCQVEDGPGLSTETVRRLACGGPVVEVGRDGAGNVLDVGRRTRRIGRRLRRALAVRDGGCRFPGCTSTRTQAHHIVHWADGGSTVMDNLVSLCSRHHHRHHEGAYRIERARGGALRFVRADGRIVPGRATVHPVAAAGGGLPMTDRPFHGNWDGDGVPMADVLTVLHQAAGTLERPPRDSAESCSEAAAPPSDSAGELDPVAG